MCWIRNQLFLHLSFVICLQCIPHNWRYIYSWWCNKTLGLLLSLVRFIQDQSLVQKSVGFHILCWSHPMCIYGSCLYLYRLFSLFCLKALCIICDGILFLWRKHSSSLRTRAVLFYVPLLHQLYLAAEWVGVKLVTFLKRVKQPNTCATTASVQVAWRYLDDIIWRYNVSNLCKVIFVVRGRYFVAGLTNVPLKK